MSEWIAWGMDGASGIACAIVFLAMFLGLLEWLGEGNRLRSWLLLSWAWTGPYTLLLIVYSRELRWEEAPWRVVFSIAFLGGVVFGIGAKRRQTEKEEWESATCKSSEEDRHNRKWRKETFDPLQGLASDLHSRRTAELEKLVNANQFTEASAKMTREFLQRALAEAICETLQKVRLEPYDSDAVWKNSEGRLSSLPSEFFGYNVAVADLEEVKSELIKQFQALGAEVLSEQRKLQRALDRKLGIISFPVDD